MRMGGSGLLGGGAKELRVCYKLHSVPLAWRDGGLLAARLLYHRQRAFCAVHFRRTVDISSQETFRCYRRKSKTCGRRLPRVLTDRRPFSKDKTIDAWIFERLALYTVHNVAVILAIQEAARLN